MVVRLLVSGEVGEVDIEAKDNDGNTPLGFAVLNNNVNSSIFEEYFEEILCLKIEPPAVIILDNAKYHRFYKEGTFILTQNRKDLK